LLVKCFAELHALFSFSCDEYTVGEKAHRSTQVYKSSGTTKSAFDRGRDFFLTDSGNQLPQKKWLCKEEARGAKAWYHCYENIQRKKTEPCSRQSKLGVFVFYNPGSALKQTKEREARQLLTLLPKG
jgi:hypothetical protein